MATKISFHSTNQINQVEINFEAQLLSHCGQPSRCAQSSHADTTLCLAAAVYGLGCPSQKMRTARFSGQEAAHNQVLYKRGYQNGGFSFILKNSNRQ